jgi:endonuclease/exonuclease/phosphatase family metal-dependent hydrolase
MAGIPLRVMTYNVGGHGARWSAGYLEKVAAVIAAAAPDVVGMQEVHRGTRPSRLADQAAELGRLTGMAVHFGPSFTLEKGGEFGNAVLARGAVLSAAVRPLPGPGEPRTILSARLALAPHDANHAKDAELDFHVTHLAAWGRFGRAARSVQIAGLVETLQQSPGPFILAGDLNAPPGAPEIGALLASELFRKCGDGVAVTHKLMRQQIDYVFAGPGWTTVSHRVIRSGPSDHWPVLVELVRDAAEHYS